MIDGVARCIEEDGWDDQLRESRTDQQGGAMSYPGYEPVKILDTFAKIAGRQVYYHKGRDEYAIESDHIIFVPLTAEEEIQLDGMRELEQSSFDAQDRHDDDGKEAGR